jgi:hypothetical protein
VLRKQRQTGPREVIGDSRMHRFQTLDCREKPKCAAARCFDQTSIGAGK